MGDGKLTARALAIGPIAQAALADGETGQIHAVFPSVFYVEFQNTLIAIGPRETDPGPITLTLDMPAFDWRKFGLLVGKKCSFFNGLLTIANRLTIHSRTAIPWSPPTPSRLEPPGQITATPPTQGYGPCLTRNALPPEVAALTRWLHQALAGTVTAPRTSLLGRGPGLTPSGDDFLGGSLIALHLLNRPEIARTLWATLEPLARTRTNAISRALLAAAARGMGSATLHHALDTYLTGKNLDTALAGLDKIGHSSGWDAFAGAVLTIRATLATREHA